MLGMLAHYQTVADDEKFQEALKEFDLWSDDMIVLSDPYKNQREAYKTVMAKKLD